MSFVIQKPSIYHVEGFIFYCTAYVLSWYDTPSIFISLTCSRLIVILASSNTANGIPKKIESIHIGHMMHTFKLECFKTGFNNILIHPPSPPYYQSIYNKVLVKGRECSKISFCGCYRKIRQVLFSMSRRKVLHP